MNKKIILLLALCITIGLGLSTSRFVSTTDNSHSKISVSNEDVANVKSIFVEFEGSCPDNSFGKLLLENKFYERSRHNGITSC